MKKGMFFSLDAVIALGIILLTILIVYPVVTHPRQNSDLGEDMIKVFSSIKVGDIVNAEINASIADGAITDLNKSFLEQIGEFYVTNKTLATNIVMSVLSTINTSENIGVWFGDYLIASKNNTPFENATNIEVDRQIISGINDVNGTITGFSARAYLSGNLEQRYFYFGGYAGDGNISVIINYTGNLTDLVLEMTLNKDCNVYINDIPSGFFENSSSTFFPKKYNLTAYVSNFHSGSNIITFAAKDLYIAGGYVKIIYISENISNYGNRHYFPGIKGIINIYDAMYIPGQLNSMDIFLHYNSNYTLFLNIGNVTVFNKSYGGEIIDTVSNSQLSAKLNYAYLSNKTVPIRLGLDNATFVSGGSGTADIVFLIDSTGSMYDEIQDVKNIIINFTKVLEASSIDWRLGLVEFKDYLSDPCGWSGDFPYKIHNFSGSNFTTNATLFRNRVNTIIASGGNDLPESHLRAINESLNLNWRTNTKKYEILLTDAPPHAKDCAKIPEWNFWYCSYCVPTQHYTWCSLYNLAACTIIKTDTDQDCNLGPKYVQNMTNKLVQNQIVFYLINKPNSSTGEGVCTNLIDVNMTNATGGKFYQYTESGGVESILLEIATNIANLTYKEQTANFSGNISTILYPDSYINIGYTAPQQPRGLKTFIEKKFDDSYSGTFLVPENSTVTEAVVVSYSGSRWTNNLMINSNLIYNLSEYGKDYTRLGDPYSINIPVRFIHNGTNNVWLSTGVSPTNFTMGSSENKIIYTLIRDVSSYSEVVRFSKGCLWDIEFEDGTIIDNLRIPSNYSGAEHCYYTNALREIGEPDHQDAIQLAVMNLLEKFDLDSDGRSDVRFTEDNLVILSTEISGIPYAWNTEVQVRRWH
jgi:hypothetical protein